MLKNINNNNFSKEVLESNKLILVDFFATWCPPCKMLSPVLEKISTSRTEFDIAKLNVDESQELAIKYKVQSVPTMILFKEGKPLERIVGFADEKQILDLANKHI